MVIQNHAGIGISFAEVRELTRRIGTVHKVQGREAEGVIFVLGHQGEAFKRARGWAGGRPNIANVAVTRAKEVLYIVGNRADWSKAGYFHTVEQVMDDFTRQLYPSARHRRRRWPRGAACAHPRGASGSAGAGSRGSRIHLRSRSRSQPGLSRIRFRQEVRDARGTDR